MSFENGYYGSTMATDYAGMAAYAAGQTARQMEVDSDNSRRAAAAQSASQSSSSTSSSSSSSIGGITYSPSYGNYDYAPARTGFFSGIDLKEEFKVLLKLSVIIGPIAYCIWGSDSPKTGQVGAANLVAAQSWDGVVTAPGLNIRLCANNTCQVMAALHQGQRVTVSEMNAGSWGRISYYDSNGNINTGYVNTAFLAHRG